MTLRSSLPSFLLFTLFSLVLPYLTLPYLTLPYLTLPCLVLSCLVWSCLAMSCPALTYLVLSCHLHEIPQPSPSFTSIVPLSRFFPKVIVVPTKSQKIPHARMFSAAVQRTCFPGGSLFPSASAQHSWFSAPPGSPFLLPFAFFAYLFQSRAGSWLPPPLATNCTGVRISASLQICVYGGGARQMKKWELCMPVKYVGLPAY